MYRYQQGGYLHQMPVRRFQSGGPTSGYSSGAVRAPGVGYDLQEGETVTRQGLDPMLEPYWRSNLDAAQNAAGQPYTPYGGQRIAGFSPYEGAAMQGIGSLALGGAPEAFQRGEAAGAYGLQEMAGAGQQGYDDLSGMAGEFGDQTTQIGDDYSKWTDAGVADAYMNPYTENVTDIAARRLEHQGARDRTLLGSSAAGAGAFGGSRHGLMERGIARDTRQQTGDMRVAGLADAYSQGIGAFNQDRAAQQGMRGLQLGAMQGEQSSLMGGNQLYQQGLGSLMSGASTMANIGGMGQNMALDRLGALEGAGQRQRGLQQAGLDMGYQDFLRQQGYPKEQVEWMTGALTGFPGGTGVRTQEQGQGGSLFGDIAGGITSGYGAYRGTQPAATGGA